MLSGIYCIKCKANGRVYVGKAIDISRRWKEHLKNLDNGSHSCLPLQQDYNKFGLENFTFEVLEVIEDRDCTKYFETEKELLDKESSWGMKLGADKKLSGYNYISKFSRKIKDVGSVTILNSIRTKILKELTPEHLAIYMVIVANYDIQLGFSTIYDKTFADELSITKSQAETLIVQLEKIGVIDYFTDERFQNCWCYSLTKEEIDLQKDIHHFYLWNKIKEEDFELEKVEIMEEDLFNQLTFQEIKRLNNYLQEEIRRKEKLLEEQRRKQKY